MAELRDAAVEEHRGLEPTSRSCMQDLCLRVGGSSARRCAPPADAGPVPDEASLPAQAPVARPRTAARRGRLVQTVTNPLQ